MIDERQEEIASLYALDLLDGEERARFEAELATDRELQALVRELRDASAALAYTAPPAAPPPDLKQLVLAGIVSRKVHSVPTTPRKSAPVAFFPWVTIAVAACFAVAAAWLGRLYFAARAEADLLRDQHAFAELALREVRQQLEAERILGREQLGELERQMAELKTQADVANLKIALLASLASTAPDAMAIAVWNPATQEGVFALEKTPPLRSDQRLELWVIGASADARPISAGTFDATSGGVTRVQFRPATAVGAVAKFAVSREPNDGVRFHTQPTEVLMLGNAR